MNIHKNKHCEDKQKIILNDHLLMIKKKNDTPTRTEVIRESTSGRDWAGSKTSPNDLFMSFHFAILQIFCVCIKLK